jgi:protein O-GlcNAc transferase
MGLIDSKAAGPGDDEAERIARDAARLIQEGNALEDAGRTAEARKRYEAAVRRAPDLARAHLNLGNVLLAEGDAPGALAAYAAALERAPDYAPAHFNSGNALARLDRPTQALDAYARALAADPAFADAEVARGNVLEDLGRLAEAEASFRRVLAARPGYAEVYYNLSAVLLQLGRIEEAERCSRRSIALRPDLAEAHYSLGLALAAGERRTEAGDAFRQALECKPDYASALVEANRCAKHLFDWARRDEYERRLVERVEAGATEIAPFSLLSLDRAVEGGMALLQRRAALQYARGSFAGALERPLVAAGSHPQRERLRIGYLSADFHEHATMHLLGGVLAAHDRKRFAVHGYSYGRAVDDTRRRAVQACEVFHDLATQSDAEAAEQIASDGIDILVDLKGYTQNARMRISARRPAPVIVSWLGYPGTLGEPRLADYIVGDPIVTPLADAAHYSETLALMPHCYQPNDRERAIGPRPGRTETGLPERGFVFCSFNQNYKLSPDVFDDWCRLLAGTPDSVLWLLVPDSAAQANLRREAEARGIRADRLVFAPHLPPVAHLGRLQLADLALDTFPYGSHTTGSDALWAGVPLITRTGKTFASRVAASLLHAVGLPELATGSREAYVALALGLAREPESLAELRSRLGARRLDAPLFDTARFTRDLERLYLAIWAQHARGEREPIVLADD